MEFRNYYGMFPYLVTEFLGLFLQINWVWCPYFLRCGVRTLWGVVSVLCEVWCPYFSRCGVWFWSGWMSKYCGWMSLVRHPDLVCLSVMLMFYRLDVGHLRFRCTLAFTPCVYVDMLLSIKCDSCLQMRTGTWEWWTIKSLTLPIIVLLTVPWPLLPTRIRSALEVSASFTITSPGWPFSSFTVAFTWQRIEKENNFDVLCINRSSSDTYFTHSRTWPESL